MNLPALPWNNSRPVEILGSHSLILEGSGTQFLLLLLAGIKSFSIMISPLKATFG